MTNQQTILDRIKRIDLDKDPLAKVYLYGSRARGTMKPDSDWDLLILLDKDKITLSLVGVLHQQASCSGITDYLSK